ncbi:hypothetical protein FN846DRAFT_1013819 [Sphaerosporella brunnea]|uniref:Uncharacterized protein n=1 Tax=Sphaerosporella brunnea TaxID=1250544 RepID=A0A5J5FAY8_9PEZI|nr:hypothetical protein FN846DRAFT_1013819 [Sphaerosporella brunnea]
MPDEHLLAATFATLRPYAMFQAASAAVTRGMPVPIVFDYTRTVYVSCALEQPRGQSNTNAQIQLLFSVPVLGRLQRANLVLTTTALRKLEHVDAARNALEMHTAHKMLFAQFAECDDNVRDLLVFMQCPNSVYTGTTNWCTLRNGWDRHDSSALVLTCLDTVHQATADANAESQATQRVTTTKTFNNDGILLVEPSAAHPITEVDEQCGEWQSIPLRRTMRKFQQPPLPNAQQMMEHAAQRMDRMHLGRLPYYQLKTTVALHREACGETDTIETSGDIGRFREDTTQLMRHVLRLEGLCFGTLVFKRRVYTLYDGSRVRLAPGAAHQRYADVMVRLEMYVTKANSVRGTLTPTTHNLHVASATLPFHEIF